MLRLSNYADGLFVGLKQTKNLPTGAKLRLFVGDKYKNNDLVNVYLYKKNSDNIQLVEKELKVEDGYIEFDVIDDASDYFVTMSIIPSSEKVVTKTDKSSSPALFVIIGILLLLVICLVMALIIKNRKNKKDNNIITDNSEVLATDPNPNNNSNSVVNDNTEVLTPNPNPDDVINNNQNVTMENGSSFEQPKIIVSETINESNIISDNQSKL